MAKASVASFCNIQFPHHLQLGLTYRSQNQLSDAVSQPNSKRFLPKINQADFHLTPIIGINSARRVNNGYSVFYSQS